MSVDSDDSALINTILKNTGYGLEQRGSDPSGQTLSEKERFNYGYEYEHHRFGSVWLGQEID